MGEKSIWKMGIILMVIPLIVVPFVFFICGMDVKALSELPTWTMIWIILIPILTSIIIFLFWYKRGVVSMQNRRKPFLFMFIGLIVLFIMQIAKNSLLVQDGLLTLQQSIITIALNLTVLLFAVAIIYIFSKKQKQ